LSLEGYVISFYRWEYQNHEDFLEESVELADIDVEGDEWSPVSGYEPERLKVSFVDGVHHVHQTVYLSSEKERGEGVFVSLGAGAMLLIKEGAIFNSRYILSERERLFVTNTEISGSIDIEGPHCKLSFRVINSKKEPVKYILNELKNLEYSVVKNVLNNFSPDFVIWDGTLKYNLRETTLPVLGVIKRHMKYFIPVEKSHILEEMKIGERTPLMLLKSLDTDRAFDRYTWYVKIDEGGLASTVRFEVSADVDRREAVNIANITAWLYPLIASREFADKRSPHNIVPIRYIEKTLSRELGNPYFIRRVIEAGLSKLKG